MDQEKVGLFIKKLRKSKSLTQAEFAEKYNVTYQAVSNWEHGKNLPDLSLLKQISQDFNISLDELLSGEKQSPKKTRSKHYLPILIAVTLFIIIIILITPIILTKLNHHSTYEFKTISSSCDAFTIFGTLAYDQKRTSIFINNINYCGGTDDTNYTHIECILYETTNNTETKISTSTYEGPTPIKLEDYLKSVEFTVDDYSRTCKVYSNNNLYLRINATADNGQVTTHKITLTLNDTCQK